MFLTTGKDNIMIIVLWNLGTISNPRFVVCQYNDVEDKPNFRRENKVIASWVGNNAIEKAEAYFQGQNIKPSWL